MAFWLKYPVDDHQQDQHEMVISLKKQSEWNDRQRYCMKALACVFVIILSIC